MISCLYLTIVFDILKLPLLNQLQPPLAYVLYLCIWIYQHDLVSPLFQKSCNTINTNKKLSIALQSKGAAENTRIAHIDTKILK